MCITLEAETYTVEHWCGHVVTYEYVGSVRFAEWELKIFETQRCDHCVNVLGKDRFPYNWRWNKREATQ